MQISAYEEARACARRAPEVWRAPPRRHRPCARRYRVNARGGASTWSGAPFLDDVVELEEDGRVAHPRAPVPRPLEELAAMDEHRYAPAARPMRSQGAVRVRHHGRCAGAHPSSSASIVPLRVHASPTGCRQKVALQYSRETRTARGVAPGFVAPGPRPDRSIAMPSVARLRFDPRTAFPSTRSGLVLASTLRNLRSAREVGREHGRCAGRHHNDDNSSACTRPPTRRRRRGTIARVQSALQPSAPPPAPSTNA